VYAEKNQKIGDIVTGALKRWGGITVLEFLEGSMKLSDIQWLLSCLFENIVSRLGLSSILLQRKTSKFISPCDLDQRVLHHFDGIAIEVLPQEYSVVELSPLTPLGSNSLLTRVQQRNVISSTRTAEVVGDIATALAIDCAAKYRNGRSGILCVASSHRIVRAQDFSSIPGFTQHFRMFGLCTSADERNLSIEKALCGHIIFYLRLLERLRSEGYSIQDISVYLSNTVLSERLIENSGVPREEARRMTDREEEYDLCSRGKVHSPRFSATLPTEVIVGDLLTPLSSVTQYLHHHYPSVNILYDLGRIAGIGYYNGPCFKIVATNASRKTFPLVDGGSSDWIAQLLRNKRMLCITSGIGSELCCREFR
jgi:hypothetical protein